MWPLWNRNRKTWLLVRISAVQLITGNLAISTEAGARFSIMYHTRNISIFSSSRCCELGLMKMSLEYFLSFVPIRYQSVYRYVLTCCNKKKNYPVSRESRSGWNVDAFSVSVPVISLRSNCIVRLLHTKCRFNFDRQILNGFRERN